MRYQNKVEARKHLAKLCYELAAMCDGAISGF